MENEKLHENFFENMNYIKTQIDKNLNDGIKYLKEEVYFEMTKEQIIESFKKLSITMGNWECYFKQNKLEKIYLEYKKVESEMSFLELCLADYNQIFNCDGIAYSLFEIGKILVSINQKKMEGN